MNSYIKKWKLHTNVSVHLLWIGNIVVDSPHYYDLQLAIREISVAVNNVEVALLVVKFGKRQTLALGVPNEIKVFLDG